MFPLGCFLFEFTRRTLVRECFKEWKAIFLKIEDEPCSGLSLIVIDHGGIGIDTQVNLYMYTQLFCNKKDLN